MPEEERTSDGRSRTVLRTEIGKDRRSNAKLTKPHDLMETNMTDTIASDRQDTMKIRTFR